MNLNFEWAWLADILASIVIISGVALAVLRERFGRIFVTQKRHDELVAQIAGLSDQIQAVDRRTAALPNHRDISAMLHRAEAAEKGVAVLEAKLDGVRDGMSRVEKMLDLLVRHHVKEPS